MPHTTCTAGHHDSERNLTVTVCAEEGRSHRCRRRCKSDDRRSTKRALSQKSEQLASTHVALLDSERREALLAHELAHQRNTHAKLNKQIKHLKNEVQKTEILLHEVLEGVWQKEVASQDTRAGAQDHNSAHEQAINKAADSIHGIGKLGMMFKSHFFVCGFVEPCVAGQTRVRGGTASCQGEPQKCTQPWHADMRGYQGQKCQKRIIFSHPHVRGMTISGRLSHSIILQDRSQTCNPTHM